MLGNPRVIDTNYTDLEEQRERILGYRGCPFDSIVCQRNHVDDVWYFLLSHRCHRKDERQEGASKPTQR